MTLESIFPFNTQTGSNLQRPPRRVSSLWSPSRLPWRGVDHGAGVPPGAVGPGHGDEEEEDWAQTSDILGGDSFSILFHHRSFQKPAVSPRVLMVF